MKLKKHMCRALAVLLALGCCACAEPVENTGAAAQETVEQRYAAEEARAIVEALFAAAAGTTADAEVALREDLSEEECTARSEELAAYRERTLPWLCAALTPEESEEAQPETQAEAEAAIVADLDAETAAEEAEESWTPEDGYAALQDTQVGLDYLELMRSFGCDGAEDCLAGTRAACEQWMAEIDAAALKELNADYACWLYCPDTPIDYPVVQAEDNAKYLHRLFNGAYNACGTLFIDYRNLPEFQDPNTLIYGHHMRNGSMFKSITYYAEQSWYEAHPYMLVMTAREIAVLELFAGYTTTKRDPCYDIAISDENDMRAFIGEAKGKSDFVSKVEPQPGDRLVTLSTCAYAFQNARYIAIARIHSVWSGDEVAVAADAAGVS